MTANETTPAVPAPVATAAPAAAAMPGLAQPVGGPVVPYKDAAPADKARIEKVLSEIDLKKSETIIFFGSKAQEQLTSVSEKMLEGVRAKDVGPAGTALNNMLGVLKGLKMDGLDPKNKPGFFGRLFGGGNPLDEFFSKYKDVRSQIDGIEDKLEGHKGKLLTDVVSLDRLYDENLAFYHTLADYIAGGEEMLRRLDQDVIPAKAKEAEATNEMLKAQDLRDTRQMRDDLERRVHDLKLTRQVALQSLPSIRLVQENDKSLITKINSTIANTLPLWKQQLAQAVTIYNAGEAAKAVKAANDYTNELLKGNADRLKEANAAVRKEVERGIIDMDTIRHTHSQLIATIEESLQIADEGKRKRAEAEKELSTLEGSLKDALRAASARVQAQAPAKAIPGRA